MNKGVTEKIYKAIVGDIFSGPRRVVYLGPSITTARRKLRDALDIADLRTAKRRHGLWLEMIEKRKGPLYANPLKPHMIGWISEERKDEAEN